MSWVAGDWWRIGGMNSYSGRGWYIDLIQSMASLYFRSRVERKMGLKPVPGKPRGIGGCGVSVFLLIMAIWRSGDLSGAL